MASSVSPDGKRMHASNREHVSDVCRNRITRSSRLTWAGVDPRGDQRSLYATNTALRVQQDLNSVPVSEYNTRIHGWDIGGTNGTEMLRIGIPVG
ncbi:hypothetical protein VTJ04DRAFT_7466 [Mycothermus thermophilus]|uniref:uncharacterized protein n=1 Tax=Humicola insolens TaxID=85995 RepID=UPI0037446B74